MKSACCAIAVLFAGAAFYIQGQSEPNKSDTEVRASIKDFISAFNKGDVDGVMSHWTANAYYRTDEGMVYQGRDAIRKAVAIAFTQNKGMKIDCGEPNIRMIGADVALEEGTCSATMPDGTVDFTDYTAIHVRRDGKWLMDDLRETPSPESDSPGVMLKDLEWLVGKWSGGPADSPVTLNIDWSRNKAFLMTSFKAGEDRIFQEGTQIVGWDPEQKTVRSWVFDSDGGFGGALWTRKGDGWQIRASATLPDGGKASATHFIKSMGKDKYSWKSVGRRIDGEVLPDVPETIFTRMPAEKEAAK